MSELDKAEYARLESQVIEVERIVGEELAHASVSGLLGEFLRNAKARMNEILPDGNLQERERKERSQSDQLAVAALVERESRLTASEKDQYGGFLKQGWFTKSNFGELESFYSSAWDRLSEEGKAQMSYRVWEGIRQGEYSFAELPENVRKKESERLYEQLTGREASQASLMNIPEQDRADFIREYEAGNSEAVAEVLGRESFSMNVSTTSSKGDSLRESPTTTENKADEKNSPETQGLRESRETENEIGQGFILADATEAVKPEIPSSKSGQAPSRI